MAHESRLTAFEQALKDEGIKGTNLEPVARSIFQQESSSGANVKTSNAGARGPMQVLPATFKAYNPQGNIDNPYDNSVGGLRYIKDLYSQTNDPGLTAVGYYGGPKAIEKAKKGIAVSDPRNPNAPNTLQYMEQVMGRTKGAPARQQQRPAVPKTIRQVAPELGPNYQAALALMAKADDLSEAREKIAEEEYLAADADFSQAKKMLAQIQPITGFVDREPRRMAKGGEVTPVAATSTTTTPTNKMGEDAYKFVADPNIPLPSNYAEARRRFDEEQQAKRASNPFNPFDITLAVTGRDQFNQPFGYASDAALFNEFYNKNYGTAQLPHNFQAPSPENARGAAQERFVNSRTGEVYYAPSGGYTNPNSDWTTNPFRVIQPNTGSVPATVSSPAFGGLAGQLPRFPTYIPPNMGSTRRPSVVQRYNTAANYTFFPRRMMAEGGLASAANIQTPTLTAKDRERQATLNRQIKEYEEQAKAYNAALEKYNAEVYNPYKAKVDEFNRAADEYNKSIQNFQPTRWNRNPPAFTLTAPTAPTPFSMTAPKVPTTQEEINQFIAEAQARARQNAVGREVAMQALQDPSRFNFGSFGLGDISGLAGTSTQLFAEGGEAKKESPSMGERVKGTAKEILRSMQYTPYDLLGAPVDIGNLALKGVDYVTGSKLATDKPVGGSEYLIQKSRELGIADEPTGSTTETLTRLGTGIVSPTAGPRAVAGAVKAAKGTAKAALEDLAMAGTGQGGSKIAQKIMEPGTAFAVRPKGGVFMGARSVDEPPLTKFDMQLKNSIEGLDKADPQQAEVANFLDKKMRNFVMKELGTADDPVFKKMLSGEMPNYTYRTNEELAAARAGDPKALKDVRDAYDASMNMNFYIGKQQANRLSGDKGYSYIGDVEKQIRKKIKEQSPNSPTELMVSGNMLEPNDLERYPTLYGTPGFKQMVEESESGALMRMMNQSDLPPHIRRAIAEGEPVFAQTSSVRGVMDLDELRDYLLTRSPNDIKNMGVADAIAKSKQWHARMEAARRDPSKFSPKQLFEGTKEMLPTAGDMKWVDVRTPDALSLEGNIMGHCVGGSSYCNAVAKETTKIVSLRDKKGVPHVTIEIQKDRDGKFSRIAQIKGTGNNSPEKYFTQVDDFLKDYSSKLGGDLSITERPNYVPPDWRYK